MNHSFGFDAYVSSISNQIRANFQKIDRAFDDCKISKDEKPQAILKSSKLIQMAHDCSQYRKIDPLSIGIFGEWGSGKTKLLRGIENHFFVDEKIIPIFFNAWRYEKDEHIIIPLFKTVLHQLKKDKDKTLYENFRILTFSLLSGFSAEFLGLKFDANSVISRLFEMQKDEEIDELDLMERIESVYFNIPQKLEELTLEHEVRFVFLIDDLDRCLPENTLKMLESIKLFLDIPGCAFVLAIDDDIVERGVEHHYKDYIKNEIHINNGKKEEPTEKSPVQNIPITGSEYLEKMIQLPFALPILHKSDVETFLRENYREIFETMIKHELREQERKSFDEQFLKLFTKIIPPIPRKLIRTIEVFKLKSELIDIDKNDLLKLIALELFAPSLFRLTKQNFPKQNIFNILNGWMEKVTIYEFEKIEENIIGKSSSEMIKRLYSDILFILKKEDLSRVKFDMDTVFQKPISKNSIERYLYLDNKISQTTYNKNSISPLASSKLENLLKSLASDDEKEWQIALNELEGGVLSSVDVDKIIEKDIDITNSWLQTIAPNLDEDDFIKVIKASKLLKEVANE